MDLGLDSLEKVSLIVFINASFGINIPDEELMNYPTIMQLYNFILENKTKAEAENINWGDILKHRIQHKLPKSWFTQRLITNLSRILFSLYFRIKVKGRENIPSGNMIIAPNHQSYIDGLFVSAYLNNKTVKNTYFYAKGKHINNWFLRFLAHTNNVISMDINKDLKASLQKMAELLNAGKNIIIFPEGTRTHNGEIGDFKKTFAILSRELNVPILPVVIDGAYKAMPRGSIIPKPFKKISIEFLKPIYPNSYNSYEDITQTVRNSIAEKFN